eukprot:2129402-Pyramimonas_sp.AAC.1
MPGLGPEVSVEAQRASRGSSEACFGGPGWRLNKAWFFLAAICHSNSCLMHLASDRAAKCT